MQTTYSRFPDESYEGQLADVQDGYIASYIADGAIIPGRLLELTTDGLVRMPQGTTTGLPIAGAAVLKTAASSTAPLSTNTTYADGDVVPVLRRGRIWLCFEGGSPALGETLNVHHSSTTADHRGKVTGTTTSVVAGSEIAVGYVQLVKFSADDERALVDVNFPALAGSIGPTGGTGATGPTGPTGPT